MLLWFVAALMEFLSTPSARRATRNSNMGPDVPRFLSTPSMRRATMAASMCAISGLISIHALHEEGDP